MKCPYCQHEATDVINTRPTYHQTQIWRRRRCVSCRSLFTTYERLDLGFLKVVKKAGQKERYSRAKVYSGIYKAFLSVDNKEKTVDEITSQIEANLLELKQKEISSKDIARTVLRTLKSTHPSAFLRYLAYNRNINGEDQLKKELNKY